MTSFSTHAFSKEWVRAQKLVDFIAAALDRCLTMTAMFGVFRHERDGVAETATRERMRLAVPHVRRAVLIVRLIDLKAAEAATMSEMLDRISAGMFVVGSTGSIVQASSTGRRHGGGQPDFRAAGRSRHRR